LFITHAVKNASSGAFLINIERDSAENVDYDNAINICKNEKS